MNKLLTIDQICGLLQITRQTEYRYRKAGKLKPSINDGKLIRYSMDDLKQHIVSDAGVK